MIHSYDAADKAEIEREKHAIEFVWNEIKEERAALMKELGIINAQLHKLWLEKEELSRQALLLKLKLE